ncbi:hypothetical protein BJI69_08175 [Luteibacter rhizovicinus DSM 16549]|uniref:Uncharacterized protein n=1 Tax=Luteibacter rhizovicinus DSM 16549 TaxID=1440763 RepID=A0A1L3ES40_9GAMM|nr:hypothetical protein [Luteibacter rhizovicinus]APG03883.1 hypothetical protein BJI69_08175 [Luteibacter rhizovicinus DSM 16549]
MLDTIEILEAIGRDASLRHASKAKLADVLSNAHASEALASAVKYGDASHLAREFGTAANFVPQAIQTFFAPG